MSTYDKPIHFSYQESMESGASKGNGADKKESLAVFYDVYIVGEERLTSVTMANLGMMQMTLTRKGDRVTTVVVIDAAGRKDGYEAAKGAAATTAKFEPLLPVGLSPAFAPTVDSDRELSYSLNGDSRSYKFDERGKLTEVESTRGGRPEKRTVLTGWKASGAGDFGEYPTSIVYEQHKNDVLEVTRVDNIRVDNATADAIGALKNLVAGGDVQWRSDSTRQTRMAEAVRQAEKSAK